MPDVPENLYDGWRTTLRDGRVAITRCAQCKKWEWYPLLACSHCLAQEWEWVNVEPKGVVFTWTRVVRPTVTREGLEPPYVLTLVELPQANGARVLALMDPDAGDPAIGSEVSLVPVLLGEAPVLTCTPARA